MTWGDAEMTWGNAEMIGKGGKAHQLISEICIGMGVLTYRLDDESIFTAVIPDSLYRKTIFVAVIPDSCYRESILRVFPRNPR